MKPFFINLLYFHSPFHINSSPSIYLAPIHSAPSIHSPLSILPPPPHSLRLPHSLRPPVYPAPSFTPPLSPHYDGVWIHHWRRSTKEVINEKEAKTRTAFYQLFILLRKLQNGNVSFCEASETIFFFTIVLLVCQM